MAQAAMQASLWLRQFSSAASVGGACEQNALRVQRAVILLYCYLMGYWMEKDCAAVQFN